jgi:hypothetical protein
VLPKLLRNDRRETMNPSSAFGSFIFQSNPYTGFDPRASYLKTR